MKFLRAVFLTDDRLRLFTGARCELPTGEDVEVRGRRTPLFDLARDLDARGWGGWQIQIHTPAGTPSLSGRVEDLAGLTVEETSKGGLRLRRYRPFPVGGRSRGGDRPDLRARSTRGSLTALRSATPAPRSICCALSRKTDY